MKIFSQYLKSFENNANEIISVCSGQVIPIEDVNDIVFSKLMLGKGVGIIAEQKELISPISGEVTVVFPTKHAIGIRTNDNVEVLIHVGIDTVELNGDGFECLVRQGQKIKKSDKLCVVDFDFLKSKGYDNTIMLVVTNTKDFKEVRVNCGYLIAGDVAIEVIR